MTGVNGGDDFGNPNPIADLMKSGDSSTNDSCFDASQYSFFGGKNVVEEVELGGLEEEDVVKKAGLEWLDDVYPFSFTDNEEKEEGEILESLSDIDDLTSTFAKLNRTVSEPRTAGVIGDRGSFSRESSSTVDWTQEPDISENVQDNKRWWSHPYTNTVNLPEPKPLYRTSSYPQKLPQHRLSEPINSPNSSLNSHPLPIGTRSQLLSRHSSIPFLPNQLNLAGALPYNGSMAQFSSSSSLSISNRIPNQWLNHGRDSRENSNPFPSMLQQQLSLPSGWENPSLFPSILHQQLSLPNGLYAAQLLSQQQQRLYQAQQFSHLQSRLFNSQASAQTMNKFDHREHRGIKSSQKGRQNTRFSQQSSDTSSQKGDAAIPQFRSKYMSAEEIGSILKIQHASTHNTDSYTHDYYHQACLAKKTSNNSKLKNQFHPSSIKDLPSRSRSNNSNDQHAFPQVDALGRLPFSSIRRPRPLLEVDHSSISIDGIVSQKASMKPLEQEPMFAARITIEDGLCLLLDIDDIDRFLQYGHTQDGSSQMRRRRQVLLEGLAASLQLVDPFNRSISPGPKDDLIFLRLTSLPKGRKLISRFLQLLYPGSELTRIVCMAIFRHLRFLFGGLPSDASAAETTMNLSRIVSNCVLKMDLGALSACLAAVVCSSEQPPLRPLGSSSGDGASVIIKSVLERAADLLQVQPLALSTSYNTPNLSLWRASFDAFFVLLTKYCSSKYDSIMQSLLMNSSSAAIGSDISKAVGREMPIELLRASIPHTNDLQRQQLLDFAHRSMSVTGYSAHGTSSGLISSESVPG